MNELLYEKPDLIPHDLAAEQSALASFMLDEVGDIRRKMVKMIKPDSFYLEDHRKLAEVLWSMHENGKAIDAVTVTAEFKAAGSLNAFQTVSETLIVVPSSVNGLHYAGIVRDLAVRRFLILVGNRMASDAISGDKPPAEMLLRIRDGVDKLLSKLQPDASKEGGFGELSERVDGMVSGIIRNVAIPGFPLLSNLSKMTMPGSVAMLVGLPGDSKSFLVLNWLWRLICDGTECAFLNAEQSRAWMLQRLIAMLSGDWNMLNDEWLRNNAEIVTKRMHQSSQMIEEVGKSIYQTSISSMSKMEAAAWVEEQCRTKRVVFIDPLTAFKKTRGIPVDEQDEALGSSIKTSAEKHGSSVILVTHPVKNAMQLKDVMTMGDIAGGSTWQRFTDVVMFLYAHKPPKPVEIRRNGYLDQITVNRFLHIDKSRNGPGSNTWLAIDLNAKIDWVEHGVITKKIKVK